MTPIHEGKVSALKKKQKQRTHEICRKVDRARDSEGRIVNVLSRVWVLASFAVSIVCVGENVGRGQNTRKVRTRAIKEPLRHEGE